jgi:hypothetical protein
MSPTTFLLHTLVWTDLVRAALVFRAAGFGVGRVAVSSAALVAVVSGALVAVEHLQYLIRRQSII